jgi:hypothetical protein
MSYWFSLTICTATRPFSAQIYQQMERPPASQCDLSIELIVLYQQDSCVT